MMFEVVKLEEAIEILTNMGIVSETVDDELNFLINGFRCHLTIVAEGFINKDDFERTIDAVNLRK
jgi:hypothetical protein